MICVLVAPCIAKLLAFCSKGFLLYGVMGFMFVKSPLSDTDSWILQHGNGGNETQSHTRKRKDLSEP